MSLHNVVNRNTHRARISQPMDAVDEILRQWTRERPDLDASPMGIIGRISRIERRVDPLLTSVFRRLGLDRWSFDVLAALRRSGYPYELTPTQLFSSLMLTSGAITYRIDELVKAELVQRAPDPNDRRGVKIKLTKLGLVKINEAVAAHVENEAKILEHLSPKERSRLTSLLRRLLSGLEEASLPQHRGGSGRREEPS